MGGCGSKSDGEVEESIKDASRKVSFIKCSDFVIFIFIIWLTLVYANILFI